MSCDLTGQEPGFSLVGGLGAGGGQLHRVIAA